MSYLPLYNNNNNINNNNNNNNNRINNNKEKGVKNKPFQIFISIVFIVFLCFFLIWSMEAKKDKNIKINKISNIDQKNSPNLINEPINNNKNNKNNIPKNHKQFKNKKGLIKSFQYEPFAYKALRNEDGFEISIVTHVPIENMEKIAMIADIWRAPISASVLIKNKNDIDSVYKLIRNSLSVSEFVDFHFLYWNEDSDSIINNNNNNIINKNKINTNEEDNLNYYYYPINSLRNLSLKNSKTDWILTIDIDYLPNYGIYQYLERTLYTSLQPSKKLINSDLVSFVVPSFQLTSISTKTAPTTISTQSPTPISTLKKTTLENKNKTISTMSTTMSTTTTTSATTNTKITTKINKPLKKVNRYDLPETKFQLQTFIYDDKLIEILNKKSCLKCQSPTNYNKWFSLIDTTNPSPYKIEYSWMYDPYLLYNKSQLLEFYDERIFKEYPSSSTLSSSTTTNDYDKISFTFSMASQGFQFFILPDAWLVKMNDNEDNDNDNDGNNNLIFNNLNNNNNNNEYNENFYIVCNSILPDSKIKNNHNPHKKLFNEPLTNEC
ncbi:hypothetical protein DDB_G0268160 [Dictyostelium discoideum AX4]|uniref:Glycosyltransferase-like protein gnt12 n=1 Tax=Dictyostelium discoideum TaxID=44689 RepID=GNT12_DICDI|nr:hypothetical protein DDB_G0268160 [Dictyostelium discoideum AX4]Q55FD5.1 RecName: Full=Glycosyltransferase-like protein gnt12 [Dictyostelium discoideum]EAL73533.1 hypothetical protein DDB_G0268160 [Dictyostelium discoideum AX4]|eukprot:XP_647598.1 hypothetical protein DDB_G0268160 [Dictyostelium discoideum AX4]